MTEDDIKSGSEEGGLVDRDPLMADYTPLLYADADADLIVSLLLNLAEPDAMDSATFISHVHFGPGSDDLLVSPEEAQTLSELVTHSLESDPSQTGVGDPNVTPSAETPQSEETGSMPTEALPIKIIFEDDGSASGSLI